LPARPRSQLPPSMRFPSISAIYGGRAPSNESRTNQDSRTGERATTLHAAAALILIPPGARPGSAGVPPARGPEARVPRKLPSSGDSLLISPPAQRTN
jgi:hypothetical protein